MCLEGENRVGESDGDGGEGGELGDNGCGLFAFLIACPFCPLNCRVIVKGGECEGRGAHTEGSHSRSTEEEEDDDERTGREAPARRETFNECTFKVEGEE